MTKKKYIYFSAVSLFILGNLSLSGCSAQAPVRLGFTAELSGKNSESAINLRNGVQLAVEETNTAGGINKHQIALQIVDDLGTPEGARAAENKLINGDPAAIIGHFTSNQTLAGFEVTSARKVLLLSATASSSDISWIKDLFFRTVASTDLLGRGLAQYISQYRHLNSVAVIYDQDNSTYSVPMLKVFTEKYIGSGGKIVSEVKFSGSTSPDLSPQVDKMKSSNPEGVLIIASPTNSAIIAQNMALKNWHPALFAASWAQGDALIQNGGKSVEGMEIVIGFDANSSAAALQQFKANYLKRFSSQPIFTAMEGYETMQMLVAALNKTGGNAAGLPDALTGLKDFQGLTGPIFMDQYGDAIRPLYIQRVSNGQFETIETLPPGS